MCPHEALPTLVDTDNICRAINGKLCDEIYLYMLYFLNDYVLNIVNTSIMAFITK